MDQIDHAQEREMYYLAEQLGRTLRAAALDAPGSDLCTDCGEPIGVERRRAAPWAIRCINCQAWAEHVAKVPA